MQDGERPRPKVEDLDPEDEPWSQEVSRFIHTLSDKYYRARKVTGGWKKVKFTYFERHLLNLYIGYSNNILPGGDMPVLGKQNPRLIALFLMLASKEAALRKTD